jgi:hypothetical protein
MVLARVPKNRRRERSAYEFFAGFDVADQPIWSAEVTRRAAGFSASRPLIPVECPLLARPGTLSVVPDAAGNDPRIAGGFGIYDAPELWEPWTTVSFMRRLRLPAGV